MSVLKALAICTAAALVVIGALNVLLIVVVSSALPKSEVATSAEPASEVANRATGSRKVSGSPTIEPSDVAAAAIPPTMLQAYQSSVGACPGLAWTVIAGIGKVESNHARHGGATVGDDLVVRPPIIGVALDGRPGVAAIPDTDDGRLDGDPEWDRAVGPFQFIPTTWARFEDAAGGPRNPHYIPDGVDAVVWHLCPTGELDDLEARLLGYNRSQAYVDAVLAWADTYAAAPASTNYVLP